MRADGYEPLLRSLVVKGGQFQKAVFRLAPVSTAPASVALPPAASSHDLALSGPSEAQPEENTPLYKRGWFWGGIGAVVVGGVAAAFLLSGGDEADAASVVPDRMETF